MIFHLVFYIFYEGRILFEKPMWNIETCIWESNQKKNLLFFFFFCIVQNKFHVFASVIHSKNIIEWACRFT